MKYLYYPGCSLKATARAYEESLLAVFQTLALQLEELPDWNCCGTTACLSVDHGKTIAMAARNLALAERQRDSGGMIDLIAPCSGCYLALTKAQRFIREQQTPGRAIINALADEDLNYCDKVRVRHPLDVLLNDVGLDNIAAHVLHPLREYRVACYYGCQILRPYATFDDPVNPASMDRLMLALGAQSVDWPLKTRCCGATLMGTVPDAGLRLSYILLNEAATRGASVMATACPLCQLNLECYQRQMRRLYPDPVHLPVAFFPQLIGMAFGIEAKRIGLHRLLIPLEPALAPPSRS